MSPGSTKKIDDGLELMQYTRVAALLKEAYDESQDGDIINLSEGLEKATKELPSQWTLLDHFVRLYQALRGLEK